MTHKSHLCLYPYVLTSQTPPHTHTRTQCSELKHPFRSIPRGTFGSLAASCVLYTLVFLIAAVSAPASVLREDTEVLLRYAWPSPLFGYAGTMAVGLISALSCFGAFPPEAAFPLYAWVGACAGVDEQMHELHPPHTRRQLRDDHTDASRACTEVSPRILQGLAEDRAIRVLSDWELNNVRL